MGQGAALSLLKGHRSLAGLLMSARTGVRLVKNILCSHKYRECDLDKWSGGWKMLEAVHFGGFDGVFLTIFTGINETYQFILALSSHLTG